MFRVPSDPHNPTYDATFKVGFMRWLTSSGAERREWARRRNTAAQLARINQNERARQWAERKQDERDARRHERRQQRRS